MKRLLVRLPYWVKLPRICWGEGCHKLVWDEPWEMKWVVPLCMKHTVEELDKYERGVK